jgi:all-trans-retinol dehydrogenase (NAD+)
LANPAPVKCKFQLGQYHNETEPVEENNNVNHQLSSSPVQIQPVLVRRSTPELKKLTPALPLPLPVIPEDKILVNPPCPFTNPSIPSYSVFPELFFTSCYFAKMIDLDTVKELLAALAYAVYGIFVAFVMTFVPRRFRYKNVAGQVVLVTGAGSGIGRLMAKKFALKHGAIVVAWDINKQGNEETVREIRSFGGKCHAYTVDVSSRDSIYENAKKVRAEVGKVDILINNAGIVSGNKILDTTDAQIEKTFQVNSLSNFWTTKAFLPDMQKTGRGHIVTIASLAGMFGTSKLVDYCASKYAAVGFDEALRNELKCDEATKNLNTTLVCPYYINTGMFDGVASKIVPILQPEPVVNDIVAGVLTNQECIIIPRYVYLLILIKNVVPGEVGRRLAAAFGFTSGMLNFRGRAGGATTAAVKNGSKNH